MEKKGKDNCFFVFITIIFFLYNSFKFLNTQGNDLPIPSILFSLIIYLALIVLFLHKDEIIEEKDRKQKKLECYFKKLKQQINN